MTSVEKLEDKFKTLLFGEMSTDLKMVREKLDKLKEAYAAEIDLESERKRNKADLELQFDNTIEEIKMLRKKEDNYKLKLDAAKGNEEYFYDLENLSRVYGWDITEYITLENNGIQITMHYNKSQCFVKLVKNESFDLLQVYPALPSFPLIKKLLWDSQDLQALLRFCQKIFSLNKSSNAPTV